MLMMSVRMTVMVAMLNMLVSASADPHDDGNGGTAHKAADDEAGRARDELERTKSKARLFLRLPSGPRGFLADAKVFGASPTSSQPWHCQSTQLRRLSLRTQYAVSQPSRLGLT